MGDFDKKQNEGQSKTDKPAFDQLGEKGEKGQQDRERSGREEFAGSERERSERGQQQQGQDRGQQGIDQGRQQQQQQEGRERQQDGGSMSKDETDRQQR
jgi:hypothetical protein